ncbi:hypothetical protein [Massilia sp. TWR1-2-2]|uniref:hypothetical protein n=1 Tax=Massilia sp. TWR1-2-2 TaxID=2804584 RepID=UPI003CF8237D
MLSSVTRILATALLAISTAASATGSNKPPQFLTVPVLGLRVPLDRINLDQFPDDLRAACSQLYDEERFTAHMWVFGKVKDAASSYYILAGYYKWRNPAPGQRLYDLSEYGTVFTMRGGKCGGDEAGEVFDVRDLNETPLPVLQQLARDLASQSVRAFGSPDKLRAAIITQRIDFNALSPELQEAFKPYFPAAK